MYEKFYNLSARPFQLTPDPKFFYASRSHKRAIAYLLYGVKQGEGFIVVTGNVGTGKTTLVQHLLQLLSNEDVVAAQIVSTQIQEDDLLRMVASSFGIPFEGNDKATILKRLETFFLGCHNEGKRALLIIDEAQNLPKRSIEELRMLSNFQKNGRSLVQSFLLGQKEFRVTMRSPGFEQLRQRVIAAYHLRPLDVEETKGYIKYRLEKVGWKHDPHFSENAFAGIQEFTDGIPRRINMFCDRLMLYAYLEELHKIDVRTIRNVAKDVVEEQGGELGDGDEMPVVDTAYEDGAVLGGGVEETDADAGSEHRLAEVEASVQALTNSMKEEIELLRKALHETHKDK